MPEPADKVTSDLAPFVALPLWLVRRGGSISPRAFRIFALLKMHDRGNGCFPAHARLAKMEGCSADTVGRAVAELVRVGAITVTKRRTKNGANTSSWFRLHFQDPDPQRTATRMGAGGATAPMRDEVDLSSKEITTPSGSAALVGGDFKTAVHDPLKAADIAKPIATTKPRVESKTTAPTPKPLQARATATAPHPGSASPLSRRPGKTKAGQPRKDKWAREFMPTLQGVCPAANYNDGIPALLVMAKRFTKATVQLVVEHMLMAGEKINHAGPKLYEQLCAACQQHNRVPLITRPGQRDLAAAPVSKNYQRPAGYYDRQPVNGPLTGVTAR